MAAPLDFDVSLYRCRAGQRALVFFCLALVVLALAEESPVLMPVGTKVLILAPVTGLVGMSSACPLPQRFAEGRIDLDTGCLARHMAVHVRPASYGGVEQSSQRVSRGLFVALDGFPHVRQERFAVLLRGFSKQLPRVLKDILSHEVESVFTVRYPGLLF